MKTSGLLSVIIAVVLSIGVSSCGGKAKRLLSDLTDTAVQNATTGASYDKEAKFSDEEPSLLEQIKEMNLAGRLERTERMFGSPSDNLLPDELIVYYWEGLSLESVNTALCAKPESVAVPRLSADVVDSIVKSSPVPQAVERRDYVSITHWLAGQIGADVITESYWRTLDIAGFRLPEGSDGLAVAERLMTDYQNLVMLVEPGFQGKACKWEDPEETDLNMIDEDPDTFPVEPCWGAIRLGCRSIWKDPEGSTGLDGEGVYVAMLDTGLDIDYYEGEEYHDGHDEFNGRWETPGSDTGQIYDFTGDDEDHDEIPEDADGHGTFVSGLIAANDGSNEQGGGIVGVAYEATLIPIKIIDWAIDPFGWENFIPALDLVILLVTPTEEDGYGKNIRALNMSFSSELTDPPLAVQEKLSSLWLDYNVANVAAAMNDGKCYPDEQGRMPYPAGCSHVVAVGATEWRATSNKYEDSEWNNWRTSFSNWGDYIDFVAPGEGLLSTYPKDHPSGPYKSDGSGTSFSAPLIAGAFALIAQHKPEWTPTQAVHVLRRTAHSVGFYGNPAAGGLEGDRRKLPDLDALWQAIGWEDEFFVRKISEVPVVEAAAGTPGSYEILGELPLNANAHLMRPSISFVADSYSDQKALHIVCELLHRDYNENYKAETIVDTGDQDIASFHKDLESCERRIPVLQYPLREESVHYVALNYNSLWGQKEWRVYEVGHNQRGEFPEEPIMLEGAGPGVEFGGTVEAAKCDSVDMGRMNDYPSILIDPGGIAPFGRMYRWNGTAWMVMDGSTPRKGDSQFGEEVRWTENGDADITVFSKDYPAFGLVDGTVHTAITGWPQEYPEPPDVLPDSVDQQIIGANLEGGYSAEMTCLIEWEMGGDHLYAEEVYRKIGTTGEWVFWGHAWEASYDDGLSRRIAYAFLPMAPYDWLFGSRCVDDVFGAWLGFPGCTMLIDSGDWDHSVDAPTMASDYNRRVYFAMVRNPVSGGQVIDIYEYGYVGPFDVW